MLHLIKAINPNSTQCAVLPRHTDIAKMLISWIKSCINHITWGRWTDLKIFLKWKTHEELNSIIWTDSVMTDPESTNNRLPGSTVAGTDNGADGAGTDY